MLRDTDIIKKKIGADFKNFIKTCSIDYMEKLKMELNSGFQAYYDELNNKVSEELMAQESQQKDMHDKIDTYDRRVCDLDAVIEKRKAYKLAALEKLITTRTKASLFRFLINFRINKVNNQKKKNVVQKFYITKIKRKCLELIKKVSFLEMTNAFEEKIKIKTENDLREMEEGLIKQKENLFAMIFKAEEKLKHENRRKVQTKLQLDQIVLRGISALNMNALSLAQNSLNGMINFLFYNLFKFRCCKK